MCILTFIPAGVDVPWDGLFNGACANPDGHGWAVARGDELVIGKSMSMHVAIEQYEDALKALPGAVSLFHSRIATAGTVNEFNVHPFYVGGDQRSIMAHNGILPNQWQPDFDDTSNRSDTRLFADTMGWLIENQRGIPSRRTGRALGHAIGGYNKLVFMSVKSGQPRVRIINADRGVWTGGVWHSNTSFEPRRYYTKPKGIARPSGLWGGTTSYVPGAWTSRYDWDAEVLEVCIACKGNNVALGYCDDCTMCQDCAAIETECMCYMPPVREKSGPVDEVDKWLAAKEAERKAERDAQDAEWEDWMAEKRAAQAEEDREWSEFMSRQQEVKQIEASPTVVEFNSAN